MNTIKSYMAQKRLGQHFLHNGAKLKIVADALGVGVGDVVIEIGPGHGELTRYICETGAHVIAIEKDPRLAHVLGGMYEKQVSVLCGDAREKLSEVVAGIGGANYYIAGNIPYYVTGYLFRMIGELEHKPTRCVFTTQKEVALRLADVALVGMNILAASVWWWADVLYITSIPRHMFSPAPRVDSAVVLLKAKKPEVRNGKDFIDFVKKIFKQPRKTVLSNLLASGYPRDVIEGVCRACAVEHGLRPEKLSFEMLRALYEQFSIRS